MDDYGDSYNEGYGYNDYGNSEPIVLDTVVVTADTINDFEDDLFAGNNQNAFDEFGEDGGEYESSGSFDDTTDIRLTASIIEGLNSVSSGWAQSGPYTYTNSRTGQTYDTRTGVVTNSTPTNATSTNSTKAVTSSGGSGGSSGPSGGSSGSGASQSNSGTQAITDVVKKATDALNSVINSVAKVKEALSGETAANAVKNANKANTGNNGTSGTNTDIDFTKILLIGVGLIGGAVILKKTISK